MSIRQKHKEYLQSYLQSINYKGDNMIVYTELKTKTGGYPFIMISSGTLTPNYNSDSTMDINTYKRLYEYTITIVQVVTEFELQNIGMQRSLDDVEELVIDKLQSKQVRDCSPYQADFESWQDLYISSSVSTATTTNIEQQENLVYKTFTVTAEYIHSI